MHLVASISAPFALSRPMRRRLAAATVALAGALAGAVGSAPAASAATFDTTKVYEFFDDRKGLVMDVRRWSTDAGTPLIMWPSNGGANQHFRLDAVGGNYRIRNVHSGLCLTPQGFSDVVQQPCGQAGQEMRISGEPTYGYSIYNPAKGSWILWGFTAGGDVAFGKPWVINRSGYRRNTGTWFIVPR